MNNFNKPHYIGKLTCSNCASNFECTIKHLVRTGNFPCIMQSLPLTWVEIQYPRPHLVSLPEDYDIWLNRLSGFLNENKQ